ncbi:MAG: hypothetical protein LBV72_06390 [Tannerella sp.]|jgi:hypothetical protein|nr:hypothetical protein [Tannerella sp.]
MKKAIYQKLYDCLTILSDRFSNRLLTKVKIALGTALIVLTSSCSNDSDEPEVTCYLMYVPDDSVHIQSLTAPDTSIEVTELDEIEIQ